MESSLIVSMLADPTAAAAQPMAPDQASGAKPTTIELQVGTCYLSK